MRGLLVGLLVGVWACNASPDPSLPAIVPAGPPRLISAPTAVIAPAGPRAAMATWHVRRLAPMWSLPVTELPDLAVRGEVAVSGGTIVRLAQSIDGVPIERAELRVMLRDNGALVAASGVPVARSITRETGDAIDETAALARVPAAREARATRIWWDAAGQALVAAWRVEAYLADGRAERVVIAARDGRVLESQSLVDDAAFRYRVFAEATGDKRPLDAPFADSTPHRTGVPDKVYPPFVGPSLVTVDGLNALGDPWLPAGSTETVGNHADAYVDLFEPDGLDPDLGDFRATAQGDTFGAIYNTALDATDSRTQQEAAITQLFYTANWLHDFWYDAGFTEAAGNAQLSNFGRGGVEGDRMRLEAQDGALDGVRNNANMSTPSDGMSPRLQAFVFRGIETRTLTILPAGREPPAGAAEFGQREHDITAPIVVPAPADACAPITNVIIGKIALVRATTCPYEAAAKAVQDARGVGALIVHEVASGTPPTLGDDPVTRGVDIPVYSITQAEGTAIESELANGIVRAHMLRSFTPEPDSAIDATVIAHEYGHYLHRRLAACGTKLCSATSEGWGDFLALLLASREGDDLDGAYPVAAYAAQAFSDDPAYFGIRRVPYSTSFAIDGLTFRHMTDGVELPRTPTSATPSSNSEVHNAGEVWATALWEAYVALQKSHPGQHEAIRERMAAYVVAGLLLTPPDATPTEARDAIVVAAGAADPVDGETILVAFARRGMGSCAVSPPRTSGDFIGIVESMELRGAAAPGAMLVDDSVESCDADGLLDGGERGRFVAPITNHGHRVLENLSVALVSSDEPLAVIGEPIEIARLAPGETIRVEFEVALAPGIGRAPLAGGLALQIMAPGACTELVALETVYRMNADDVPASSALDKVDAVSIWTTAQNPETPAWTQSRVLSLLGIYEGYWAGQDVGTTSDSSLISPPLVASDDEPLVIAFQHRFDFEFSDNTPWDGGVVEITVDGGASWRDVTELGIDPGYTHVLTEISGNPLANRRAFAGQSFSYPTFDTVELDFGTQLAGQAFQIRFRIGTDQGTGAHGWDLDNLDFRGITGTPFPSQELEQQPCGVVDDGGCCNAGRPSGSALVALATLAMLVRRRRPRR